MRCTLFLLLNWLMRLCGNLKGVDMKCILSLLLSLLLTGCCASTPKLKPNIKIVDDNKINKNPIESFCLVLTCNTNLGN